MSKRRGKGSTERRRLQRVQYAAAHHKSHDGTEGTDIRAIDFKIRIVQKANLSDNSSITDEQQESDACVNSNEISLVGKILHVNKLCIVNERDAHGFERGWYDKHIRVSAYLGNTLVSIFEFRLLRSKPDPRYLNAQIVTVQDSKTGEQKHIWYTEKVCRCAIDLIERGEAPNKYVQLRLFRSSASGKSIEFDLYISGGFVSAARITRNSLAHFQQDLDENLGFDWPSTEVDESLEPLRYIDTPENGFLKYCKYKVGNSGLLFSERKKCLVRAFGTILPASYINTLPREIKDEYVSEWGSPTTCKRLRKIAESIAAFARNQKRKTNPAKQAVMDWERDLQWLKEQYYDNCKRQFQWPVI
jgi:hypothetical protein